MTTTEAPKARARSFVSDVLPWGVAVGALVLYLATLNPWLRLNSLPVVARVAGWDWQVNLFQPLLFLLTLPFRWLPEVWLPAALNGFTAVCASLALALLARSVALLPHDRLPIERRLELSEHSLLSIRAAWVPPLLAVIVCGLQLSFWENATVASGAMLDLLLFAYVIRCLLEFRVDERQTWLSRAALLVGLGMANDWAMMAFLPLFVVAVVWIKGLRFFRMDFLVRMGLLGLAGFSLVLLLPLLQLFKTDSPVGFWTALGQALGAPASIVWQFANRFYHTNRAMALLLAIVSLLPVFVMSLRWRTISADSNVFSSFLSKGMFNVTYVLLLAAGLWVAFDPSFGPRQNGARAGFWFPCLTLYYLSALGVGYFSGYFMLVLSDPEFWRARRRRDLRPAARLLSPVAGYTLLALIGAGLLIRNLPFMREINLPILSDYAQLTVQSLPGSGGVVLSDEGARLLLLRAALSRQGNAGQYVLLDTGALPLGAYRAMLHKRYPALWPEKLSGARTNPPLDSISLILELDGLSRSNRLFYLQPSFGYYFEQFYAQPQGLAYELKKYPDKAISGSPLTPEQIQNNENFWQHIAAQPVRRVLDLVSETPARKGRLHSELMGRLKSKAETLPEARVVARWYSVGLNSWGVRLQRNNQLPEAARCFRLAKELYPSNRAAELNLALNAVLTDAKRPTMDLSKGPDEQLGMYRDVSRLLNDNGPLDDPNMCFVLGLVFSEGGMHRQAAQQFQRVGALVPDFVAPQLMIGRLYSLWQMPDALLETVQQIRSRFAPSPLTPSERAELDFLEADAHLQKTNDAAAQRLVETAMALDPQAPELLKRALSLYISNQRYAKALDILDQHLRLDPDDVSALSTKGYLCLQTGQFSNAIPVLTRVLTLQTNNPEAMLNRAIAHLKAGDLGASKADYERLLGEFPRAYQVYVGLAEIACQLKDTNAAIRYCEGYLSNAIPGSAEARSVQERLKELRADLH